MAKGALVEVEGAARLRRTLRAAGSDLEDLKAAHRSASQIVADAAADAAPVRSGLLRDTVRASGTKTAGIVRAGFARVPYAGPIHWGWPARGIRANPFISDAARATEGRWLGEYQSHVDALLADIRGK
jgi:hypothetical protein